MKEPTILDLTKTYNELAAKLGEKPVKRFKDKPTAIARVNALTAKARALGRMRPLAPLPFVGLKHPIRANTLRGQFVKALESGTTISQLQAIADEYFKKRGKKTPENIVPYTVRILHRYNGYGIHENESRLYLVAK